MESCITLQVEGTPKKKEYTSLLFFSSIKWFGVGEKLIALGNHAQFQMDRKVPKASTHLKSIQLFAYCKLRWMHALHMENDQRKKKCVVDFVYLYFSAE